MAFSLSVVYCEFSVAYCLLTTPAVFIVSVRVVPLVAERVMVLVTDGVPETV